MGTWGESQLRKFYISSKTEHTVEIYKPKKNLEVQPLLSWSTFGQIHLYIYLSSNLKVYTDFIIVVYYCTPHLSIWSFMYLIKFNQFDQFGLQFPTGTELGIKRAQILPIDGDYNVMQFESGQNIRELLEKLGHALLFHVSSYFPSH